jgi:hypothetical protein
MPRWAFRALLLLGLAALAAGPTLAQQPATVDDLTYRDRSADGKVVEIKTETKESAKGVEVIVGGKTKAVVSPADVIKHEPGALVGIGPADLLDVRTTERTKSPAEAAAAYANLLKKAGPAAPERTTRHLTYKEAMLAAKAADLKTGDDFAPDATKAADRLAAVAKATKGSWEVWPTSKAAARLYGEVGKFDRAAQVLGELAAVPGLPRDLKAEAKLGEAAALIRGGSAPAADGILAALDKDPDLTAGPLKERLAVLRAAAKLPYAPAAGKPDAAKLEEAIAAAKDPGARAVGYNFLGDVYAAHGQTRDAMWSYLWTDTVYNQDKDEQVMAVRRLVDLMEKAGDKDRADQFRDRLARVR